MDLQRMMQARQAGAQAGPPGDTPQVDTSEQVYISSLALLKMLKHGKPKMQPNLVIYPHSTAATSRLAFQKRGTVVGGVDRRSLIGMVSNASLLATQTMQPGFRQGSLM